MINRLSLTIFHQMFGLGFSEILIIAALALILIGPKELPAIATAIGRFLNELKRSSDDFTREIKTQARVDIPNIKSELNQVVKSPSESLKNALAEDSQVGIQQNGLKNETLGSTPSATTIQKDSPHV